MGVGRVKLIVSEAWSVVPATPAYGVSLSVLRSCTLNEAAPLVALLKESRSQSMLNVPEEPVLNTMPRLEVYVVLVGTEEEPFAASVGSTHVVTAADPVETRQSRAARPERMLRVREGMFIRIFVQVGAAVSAVTIGVSGSAARGRKPNVDDMEEKKDDGAVPQGSPGVVLGGSDTL